MKFPTLELGEPEGDPIEGAVEVKGPAIFLKSDSRGAPPWRAIGGGKLEVPRPVGAGFSGRELIGPAVLVAVVVFFLGYVAGLEHLLGP